ncbi:MAG TPA: LysE family translocator [Aeromonadales bacterium]|nr:LysE family translocator [Aeromonadales bacterium]
MTIELWHEFITVAAFHLLAVISPGPDFAVVVKQSVSQGRKIGIYTAFGVGTAILIHVSYSLLGIGLLIRNSQWLFDILKYVAAAYLFYIGTKAIRSKKIASPEIEELIETPQTSQRRDDDKEKNLDQSFLKAYWMGFLTNGLNPKATLFFFSLFAVVISPNTPVIIQVGYGIYMAIVTALWFVLVALLFGHKRVRIKFEKMGHWFDRVMGVALIALGIKIATTSLDV